MRIERIDYRLIELPWRERFTTATSSSNGVRNWLVRIEGDGSVGYGCAAPCGIARETVGSADASFRRLCDCLQGQEVNGLHDLHTRMDAAIGHASAAKAGIDLAFYDALARSKGNRLCEFLGGRCGPLLTSMTIGIMPTETAVERAVRFAEQGFKALKLKVGTSLKTDIERTIAVRDAVGEKIALRVDANQGYSKGQALRFLEAIAGVGIEFLEQPVKARWWNWRALTDIARCSPIPIMADEAVRAPEEAKHAFELGIRLVNIKLMKCGGIHNALRVAEIAREHGGKAMIGCFGESGVSLAAALHFGAACSDVIRWADLDSQFLLARDICKPLRFEDGMLWPEGPGNGIELHGTVPATGGSLA